MNHALRFTLLGLAVVVVLFAVTWASLPGSRCGDEVSAPKVSAPASFFMANDNVIYTTEGECLANLDDTKTRIVVFYSGAVALVIALGLIFGRARWRNSTTDAVVAFAQRRRWVLAALLAFAVTALVFAEGDNGCGRGHLLGGTAYLVLLACAPAVSVLAYLLLMASARTVEAGSRRVVAYVLSVPVALGVGGLVFGLGAAIMYGDWACTS